MMTITTVSLLIAALALLFSVCTVSFSILAYCKVVGLENSTHKVQYMPMEEFDQFKDERIEEEAENEEDDAPMGMPLSGAEKKEKKRIEKLQENFGQMYEERI